MRIIVLTCLLTGGLSAQYHVDAETSALRVVRLTLGPDQTAPATYIQDAVLVCLNECHVRLALPASALLRATVTDSSLEPTPVKVGQRLADIHMEAGATRVLGAGKRSITNLSSKPVEMLFVTTAASK
jgi:hypothetical protein